jgi:hypothetical protein
MGHGVHRRDDVLLGLFEVFLGTQLRKLDGSDERPGPGPEVLGRKLGTHNLLYVSVEVAGFDILYLAVLIDVFEDLVPGQSGALLDDLRELPVRDALALELTPLPGVGPHWLSPL